MLSQMFDRLLVIPLTVNCTIRQALNSVSRVPAARFDVEELPNEVNLHAGRDANHEDLDEGPRTDIAFVIAQQCKVT